MSKVMMRAALGVAALAFSSVAMAQGRRRRRPTRSRSAAYQVRVMEGALVGAVSLGAGQVSRKLQPVGQPVDRSS